MTRSCVFTVTRMRVRKRRADEGTTVDDVFVRLMDDHRQLQSLLRAVAETEPGARRVELVQQFTDALLWHLDFEEYVIFPLATGHGGLTVDEPDADNKLTREILAKMAQLVHRPGFGGAVEMLMAAVNRHIEHEEYKMFPGLLSACTGAQLAALGHELSRAEADTLHAFIPIDLSGVEPDAMRHGDELGPAPSAGFIRIPTNQPMLLGRGDPVPRLVEGATVGE